MDSTPEEGKSRHSATAVWTILTAVQVALLIFSPQLTDVRFVLLAGFIGALMSLAWRFSGPAPALPLTLFIFVVGGGAALKALSLLPVWVLASLTVVAVGAFTGRHPALSLQTSLLRIVGTMALVVTLTAATRYLRTTDPRNSFDPLTGEIGLEVEGALLAMMVWSIEALVVGLLWLFALGAAFNSLEAVGRLFWGITDQLLMGVERLTKGPTDVAEIESVRQELDLFEETHPSNIEGVKLCRTWSRVQALPKRKSTDRVSTQFVHRIRVVAIDAIEAELTRQVEARRLAEESDPWEKWLAKIRTESRPDGGSDDDGEHMDHGDEHDLTNVTEGVGLDHEPEVLLWSDRLSLASSRRRAVMDWSHEAKPASLVEFLVRLQAQRGEFTAYLFGEDGRPWYWTG